MFSRRGGFRKKERGKRERASTHGTNVYFLPPARLGLPLGDLSGCVLLADKPRAPVISGPRAALASDLRPHQPPGGGESGRDDAGRAEHSICRVQPERLSNCGRKRARSRQPPPGRTSLRPAPPARLPRAPFWGVRKGNFGELGGEECGAKWDERRNVPRSRFRTPVESRRRGRAGAGPGRAGFRAAAARRGGARGPQVQFPVLPRGGAGAADQVTERSSGAAGSRLVLSRRRRRRRRHT